MTNSFRSIALITALALALTLTGCASQTLIDAGAITVDEYDNLIDLPFFTNRGIEISRGGERFFGEGLGDLRSGYCYIGINDGENGDGDLVRVASRTADELFVDLDAHAAEGIVVYVHGYNMSFNRSCRHAATLKRRLGLSGGLLLFTWPANSSLVTYHSDISDMRASTDVLFRLLDDLGARYGRDKVNIIGHSLGSRGVIDSLKAWQPGDKPFAQLILIAADIDRALFVEALPELQERIDEVTVLVSNRDRTLLVSQVINLSSRLGRSDDVALKGVDFVNVTELEGHGSHFTGHIYHLRNSRVADLIRDKLYGEPAFDGEKSFPSRYKYLPSK